MIEKYEEYEKMVFSSGINIICGEDGTGKYDILDSLSWIEGSKLVKNVLPESLVDIEHCWYRSNLNVFIFDKPDSQLDHKNRLELVKILIALCNDGKQIILTSHNYFFVKEFDIWRQSNDGNVPIRFFNLFRENDGGAIIVESGGKLADLSNLAMLDYEIDQYDRELDLLYKKA